MSLPANYYGETKMFEGACLCGEIHYRVNGEIEEVSHCHCGMCRQIHGAAFGTYAGVKAAGFQWLSGTSKVKSYTSSNGVHRTFCAACGSTLRALFDAEPEMIYLTMGTVQGNPEHPEPFHIFVGSKAPWFTITDDFPQYEEWRDQPQERKFTLSNEFKREALRRASEEGMEDVFDAGTGTAKGRGNHGAGRI